MKKKCSFCGTLYAEEEFFCPECGGLVYEMTNEAQEEAPSAVVEELHAADEPEAAVIPAQPEAEIPVQEEEIPVREEEAPAQPMTEENKDDACEQPSPDAPKAAALPVYAQVHERRERPRRKAAALPVYAQVHERREHLRRMQKMSWYIKRSGLGKLFHKGEELHYMACGELRFEKVGLELREQLGKSKATKFFYTDMQDVSIGKYPGKVTPTLVLQMKNGKTHILCGAVTHAAIQEAADVIHDILRLDQQA